MTASQITNLMTQQRRASGLLTSLKHLNVRYKYPEGFPLLAASQITSLMTQQRRASGLLTSLKHLNVRYKYPEGFPSDRQPDHQKPDDPSEAGQRVSHLTLTSQRQV